MSFHSHSISCQALTELVSTCDGSNEDGNLVRELVVMALGDPHRYLFNELLEIEAVNLQKMERFYQVCRLSSLLRVLMYVFIYSCVYVDDMQQ